MQRGQATGRTAWGGGCAQAGARDPHSHNWHAVEERGLAGVWERVFGMLWLQAKRYGTTRRPVLYAAALGKGGTPVP